MNFISKIYIMLLINLYIGQAASNAADNAILCPVTIEQSTIQTGKQTQLDISIPGTNLIVPPEFPFIEGLTITFVRMVPKTDVTHYLYRIVGLRPGTFKAGPVSFVRKGVSYKTGQIIINIEKEPISAGSAPAPEIGLTDKDLAGHIYIALSVPRSRIYVNEKINISVTLHSDWLDVEDITIYAPSSNDLIVEKYGEKKPDLAYKNGAKYIVLEYPSSLYSVTTGEYTLDPVKVTFYVSKARKEGKDAVMNANRLFYDSFIGTDQRRPVTLRTEPYKFTVLPLPGQGRPDGFSGAIGEFLYDLSLSPYPFKAGDTVTLNIAVTGQGNFETVKLPFFSAQDGISPSAPKISRSGSAVNLTQDISIGQDNTSGLPELVFSYFEPVKGSYITCAKGPFMPQGARPVNERPLSLSVKPGTVQTEVNGIVPLKRGMGHTVRYPLDTTPGFGLVLFEVIPAIFLLFGSVYAYHARRLRDEPVYRAWYYASRGAKKNLHRARDLAYKNRSYEFYSQTLKTLEDYFSERLFWERSGITKKSLASRLSNKVDPAISRLVDKVFEDCYLAHYARLDSIPDSMVTTLKYLKKIITTLDKERSL